MNLVDWAYGLGGGLMIGAAAAILLLLNGRIAGVSGVIGGLMAASGDGERSERFAFILGLLGAPLLYVLLQGAPAITVTSSLPILVAAGLLVGVGVRMGGGCTSGHGVCGLSRFSVRSLVGVASFIAAGVATVTIGRHLIGGL